MANPNDQFPIEAGRPVISRGLGSNLAHRNSPGSVDEYIAKLVPVPAGRPAGGASGAGLPTARPEDGE